MGFSQLQWGILYILALILFLSLHGQSRRILFINKRNQRWVIRRLRAASPIRIHHPYCLHLSPFLNSEHIAWGRGIFQGQDPATQWQKYTATISPFLWPFTTLGNPTLEKGRHPNVSNISRTVGHRVQVIISIWDLKCPHGSSVDYALMRIS